MSTTPWNHSQISDQTGKTVIVTGATSGLGKEATRVLAEKNATIILAVRNVKKAEAVVTEIKQVVPQAKLEIRRLDLGSLASVETFAEEIHAHHQQLDILINNAGVMMCPYSKTEDGFEIQMGVNHLGPFALTGRLLPLLKNTPNSRVVITSSVAHKQGNIDFSDLNWEKRKYKTGKAYSDSKIANLYHTYELAKRLKSEKNAPIITCAHPGWTKTELDRHSGIASFMGNMIAQKVDMGTLPTLRAAVDPEAKSGDYFGPTKMMEMRGYPEVVQSNALSHNSENAKKLWELSEKLTGVRY